MKKVLYFDTETTGLDSVKNDIIQLAGFIEIDGIIKEKFNYNMQPFSYENITSKSIQVHGIDIEKMKTFRHTALVHNEFVLLLGKYVDE